jgi:hypothetical protein
VFGSFLMIEPVLVTRLMKGDGSGPRRGGLGLATSGLNDPPTDTRPGYSHAAVTRRRAAQKGRVRGINSAVRRRCHPALEFASPVAAGRVVNDGRGRRQSALRLGRSLALARLRQQVHGYPGCQGDRRGGLQHNGLDRKGGC